MPNIAPIAAASRSPNVRQQPWRTVVRARPADPRHPIFQDMHLACGHVLVHRPLKRGPDRRFHRPVRLRCPYCPVDAVQAQPQETGHLLPARFLPAQAVPMMAAATLERPAALVTQEAEPPPFDPQLLWSPRDLAARTWE